eukprot:1181129-Amphidinium_carterae.1
MWEDSKQQETSVEGRRRTKQRPRSTLAAPVARPAGGSCHFLVCDLCTLAFGFNAVSYLALKH